VQDKIALAKRVLTEDTKVLYGIFGIINTSGYFPPHKFLNEFFLIGMVEARISQYSSR